MQFLDLPLASHQEAFPGLCGVLGAVYRSQHFQSPYCFVHWVVTALKSNLQGNLKVNWNKSFSMLQPSLQ